MDLSHALWVLALHFIIMISVCFAQWSYYGPLGPSSWSELWPSCCAGNKQSPIDIDPFQAHDLNTSALNLHGYGADNIPHPAKMEFVNNGQTVEILLTGNFFINGGPLDASYQAVKVNFHWGKTDDVGSEHSIQGRRYAGEIQIIHYDRDHLRSVEEALEYKNGLAVLAVFIEINEKPNPAFEELFKVVNKVRFKGNTYVFPTVFPLESLLPNKPNRDDYFFYEGSLTVPRCNEAVQWIVFRKPIIVSKQQLSVFRQIQTSGLFGFRVENKTLVNNFRPTQPLNGRTVYRARTRSNAIKVKYSAVLTGTTAIISVFTVYQRVFT